MAVRNEIPYPYKAEEAVSADKLKDGKKLICTIHPLEEGEAECVAETLADELHTGDIVAVEFVISEDTTIAAIGFVTHSESDDKIATSPMLLSQTETMANVYIQAIRLQGDNREEAVLLDKYSDALENTDMMNFSVCHIYKLM